MRNLTKFIAVAAIAVVLLPTAAFADNGKSGRFQGDGDLNLRATINSLRNEDKREDREDRREDRRLKASIAAELKAKAEAEARAERENRSEDRGDHRWFEFWHKIRGQAETRIGTVTSIGTNSFTMTVDAGTTLTVNTASAKLWEPFDKSITLTDIAVNDKAQVKGTLSGNTMTATWVMIMPQNTHPAKASGVVTAASANALTVQTEHQGVISNVSVTTDANTEVKNHDGSAATTADVKVGTAVKVKGLWNEVLNVLNAMYVF
jgi:hypothetical protein